MASGLTIGTAVVGFGVAVGQRLASEYLDDRLGVADVMGGSRWRGSVAVDASKP